MLWALVAEGSGFPARLLAKESVTLERLSRTLGGFSEESGAVQKGESSRRTVNTEMTEIWQKLRSIELNGLPHIPKWFLYSVRAIFTFLLVLCLALSLSSGKSSFSERLFMCSTISAITFGIWQIGIPHRTRQLAQKFQKWDNPAIAGSLCDMLTWSDNTVRKEARTGLTRLLPQIYTAELHQLYSSYGFLFSRMLTPAMAKRETEFVLAILGAFERIGAVKEKSVVRQLAEMRGESPQMQCVREAAQNCLATLDLIEQQKTQQQTLLRASASASTDHLLRAGIAPMETKPGELLRPVEE